MEINLLPRRSLWETYRVALIVFVSVLVLSGVGSAVLYYLDLNTRIDVAKADLVRLRSDTVKLMAERTLSPQSKQFSDLKAKVDGLTQARHDYGQILDSVAAKMSSKMRIITADMNTEKNKLTLLLDTESIDVTADYAQSLRGEAWVKDVFVSTIENKDTSIDVTKPSQPAAPKIDAPFQVKLEILLQPEQIKPVKSTK